MKRGLRHELALHGFVLVFAALALLPFVFVVNNSFRTNNEIFHSFFGVPRALKDMALAAKRVTTGSDEALTVVDGDDEVRTAPPREAFGYASDRAFKGFRLAWDVLRGYMLNSFFVSLVTAVGVVLLGSISAYVLSRYRFPGSRFIFIYVISTMMFPGVLTLVPLFLLIKAMGLLNSHWALILPYVAGGQVFATFVFKSFFDGLPEELFEAARIDGAGHVRLYVSIVLPLTKPVLAVVLIMNILSSWNNFLWPFIVNTDENYHVVASGLFVMANTFGGANYSTMFAAYILSSIPLLLLFIYATRPFIEGVASGAFKA
ncbi:MAG: carbohydrate ABC transporter permease [Phycisphaerae bacterium]|nr:carbohydrate ABC transporter permease [Phycisphaerae bacterium]